MHLCDECIVLALGRYDALLADLLGLSWRVMGVDSIARLMLEIRFVASHKRALVRPWIEG